MDVELRIDQQNISSGEDQLQEWRDGLLQTLLVGFLILGALLLATNLRVFSEQGNTWAIIVGVGTYLGLVVVTFLRKAPFIFRAHAVIWLNYGVVILSYTLYGLNGDARIWVLYLVILSTLLLGLRFGIFMLVLGIATHAVFGFGMITNIVSPPTAEVLETISNTTPNGWVSTAIGLLFTTVLLTVPLGRLLKNLGESMKSLEGTLISERLLTEELESEKARLQRRSTDLERRVTQIRTAAEIASSLGAFLEPQELLNHVVNLIIERFNLYYVGIFLIDDIKRFAVLSAGTGEAGQRMMEDGHKLSVGGSSMIGWCTANRKARIALDVGQEAIRFKNPHLPNTRSELALPIAIGNNSLGALTIQSTEAEAFDNNDIIILQSIADSLAISLDNARLFQQFESSLKEIRQLNRQYLGDAWTNIVEDERDLSFEKEFIPSSHIEDLKSVNIPLTLRDDQVIGEIILESDRIDWTTDEKEFISAVSAQAAIALESARLLEETQRNVERERALNQLTSELSLNLDFDTLIQNIVEKLGQLPKVIEASIHFSPPEPVKTTNGSTPEETEPEDQ